MIEDIEKANFLIEKLQYLKEFHGETMVIKCGGSAINNSKLNRSFIEDIVTLKLIGIKVIIVHGGGPSINEMLMKLKIESKFYNGFRITDEKTMEIVEMVLAGKINKGIVRDIQLRGVNAIGICGKDGNLLQVKKKIVDGKDLGFVGEVTEVNTQLINKIIEYPLIPVIAPIGIDNLGNTYNINADDAALAIAQSLRSERLIFLTDVSGILLSRNDENSLIPVLKVKEALSYINNGIITDGMIPKVRSCVEAINSGVKKVHIIDGRMEHSLLLEIFTPLGIGTMVEN